MDGGWAIDAATWRRERMVRAPGAGNVNVRKDCVHRHHLQQSSAQAALHDWTFGENLLCGFTSSYRATMVVVV